MSKPKWYSRRTANKHAKILKYHLKVAKDKPVLASVATTSGSPGQFFNDSRKRGHKGMIANYKASTQPVSPMHEGKMTRRKDEVLKLVCRKAK